MKAKTLFGLQVVISDAVPPGQAFIGHAKADFVRGQIVSVSGLKIINLKDENAK